MSEGKNISQEFPQLHTQRLRLRAMANADADGYAELLSDPETYPYITESGPVRSTEISARIRGNVAAFGAGRHIYWSVEFDGHFVGFVALHGFLHACPALSYAIRPAWRRQAIALEALRTVCDYAFSSLDVQELVARTHYENKASAQLLLRLGFRDVGPVATPEGQRREFRVSAA